MRRHEDALSGIVTLEFNDGRRLKVEPRELTELGLAGVLEKYGEKDQLPKERVLVMQRDRVVGSVPGDFEPRAIKSRSFFYDPRPGDFVHFHDVWIVSNTLGPGDLDAIPGFIRKVQ